MIMCAKVRANYNDCFLNVLTFIRDLQEERLQEGKGLAEVTPQGGKRETQTLRPQDL